MRFVSTKGFVRAGALLAAACAAGAASLAQAAPHRDGQRSIRITRPGAYVLHHDVSLSGEGVAVEVTASNVTLDLNGHSLSGPGGAGVGVRIAGVSGVHVHNGIITSFGTGVEVRDSVNVRIDDLQIQGQDLGGPPPGEVGVLVFNSKAVVVESNTVSQTFLGIFVRGGGSSGNHIAGNTVTGGLNGQLGICYNPDGLGTDAAPHGDRVYNNLVSRFNLGIQTSAETAGNVFRANDLAFVVEAVNEVTPGSNLFQDNAEIAITLP